MVFELVEFFVSVIGQMIGGWFFLGNVVMIVIFGLDIVFVLQMMLRGVFLCEMRRSVVCMFFVWVILFCMFVYVLRCLRVVLLYLLAGIVFIWFMVRWLLLRIDVRLRLGLRLICVGDFFGVMSMRELLRRLIWFFVLMSFLVIVQFI